MKQRRRGGNAKFQKPDRKGGCTSVTPAPLLTLGLLPELLPLGGCTSVTPAPSLTLGLLPQITDQIRETRPETGCTSVRPAPSLTLGFLPESRALPHGRASDTVTAQNTQSSARTLFASPARRSDCIREFRRVSRPDRVRRHGCLRPPKSCLIQFPAQKQCHQGPRDFDYPATTPSWCQKLHARETRSSPRTASPRCYSPGNAER